MPAKFLKSLTFRILLMLSLALLPIGLIALYQTNFVARQTQELERSALVGETLTAIEPQRDLLHNAFSEARTLVAGVLPLHDSIEECVELMERFIDFNPKYSLAMFVRPNGVSRCNSNDSMTDIRTGVVFRTMQETRSPKVFHLSRGAVGGLRILVVTQPVFDEERYLGFVSISLPHKNLQISGSLEDEKAPREIITFNDDGELLYSLSDDNEVMQEYPTDIDLRAYVSREISMFVANNRMGEERIYISAPAISNLVYTITSWDPNMGTKDAQLVRRLAVLFPVVMWLTSLVVAYFAIHRLVIRHLRALNTRMHGIAEGKWVVTDEDSIAEPPAEIREIRETFDSMAKTLTQNEAELVEGLREKNILLREVHHRVKNNLQLISSIISMETRKSEEDETRKTLKRVQDRVMGLASVHSSLYNTAHQSGAGARKLLDEIVRQTVRATLAIGGNDVDISVDIDDVTLLPDQAVPLSLLMTEAATNALKYIGKPSDTEKPWMKVTLHPCGNNKMRLEVRNSRGAALAHNTEGAASSGLGNQLITAFAMQLSAKPEITETDREYGVRIDFTVATDDPTFSYID